MFTAALLTIAKIQKQQKCPLTEGCRKRIPLCIHTHTHTHTHTQWNTTQPLKNNEIMPFAAIFAAPRDYHIKLVRKKKTNTV